MGTIKKNFIFNIILNFTNLLFPIITFPYVSRIIGPEGVGKVQFIINFTQYFVVFAALGIPIYGIREIAKCKSDYRRVFSELLTINLVTSLFFLILYFCIILTADFAKGDLDLYIYGGLIVLLSFSNVDWLFSGLEKFKLIAIRSLIVKVICFIILFLCVKEREDVLGYLIVCILASALNNLWNMIYSFRKVNFSLVRIENLRKHLSPLIIIFFSVLSTTIYNLIDVFFIGILDTYRSVGLYSAASKIPKLFIPVLTSLGAVLVPSLSSHFNEKKHSEIKNLIDLSFKAVILLGVPITVGVFVLSDEIMVLFSGNDFLDASLTLKMLSPLVFAYGISNILAVQILTPSANDRRVTFSVLVGLLISLISNYILINNFSYNGAAMAGLLTEFTVLLLFYYFSNKVIKIIFPFLSFLKALGVSLLFFPIVNVVKSLTDSNILVVFLSVSSCSIVYLVLQHFVLKNELIKFKY
jgi:O-antigen/teichoic acid export membrane protein